MASGGSIASGGSDDSASGGQSNDTGGSAGALDSGGTAATGGTTVATGGTTFATGGTTVATGGTTDAATGGTMATGGSSASATGGVNATGGIGSPCGTLTSFNWNSSGPLISPLSDASHSLVSIKDPTIVFFKNQWNVYATVADSSQNYSMVYLSFADFSQASAAPQYYLSNNPNIGSGYHCAPQVFYFAPQNKWYLIYQSGPPTYSTADDPTQPDTWSAPKVLMTNGPTNWIDFWVICDAANCHLFFSGNDGKWYRAQTTLQNFPSGWGTYSVVMQDPVSGNLFEGSNVYKLKGETRYLALIEAYNSESLGRRFYRSWTADALDGTWTPLADTYSNPFASANNVTFSGSPWTNSISHGEMIRDGYDQTMTIDTCNLRYLYQGVDPNVSVSYNLLPWKLGLLTATN